jgi:hypothetical protein
MKKSKIFLTTGTLVLAVTAIFATKAAKKFAAITTAKTTESGVNFILKGGTAVPMTTAIVGNQLELNLAGKSDLPLVTISSTDHAVYFR